MLRLETIESVLLVDDSPQKRLLNDVQSVVHLGTWPSDNEARFIIMQLQPWLEDLFKSTEFVIM